MKPLDLLNMSASELSALTGEMYAELSADSYTEANSRADLLAAYLSIDTSTDAPQTDPNASLGGYRSCSRADSLGVLQLAPLTGVRIEYASPGNGVGIGSLRAVDVDALAWTPPGGEAGDNVTIAADEQKIISGSLPGQYLIVTRTTAADLGGQATVSLSRSFNDLFGQSDGDLSVSTDPTYRLVILRAGRRGVVKNLKIWIGTGDATVRIASESPVADAFQTIADEETAPTAVTFVSPTSAIHADVISVPTLAPGAMIGIWIERTIEAEATPRATVALHWSYTAVG